jgi:hypothetical protein
VAKLFSATGLHQVVGHQHRRFLAQDVDDEEQHLVDAILLGDDLHGGHQAVLAVQHDLGRGGFQHADAELLAADLVFLAVHPQQLGVGEGRDVGFRGEHLGGVIGDRRRPDRRPASRPRPVGFGRGGRAEFQRVDRMQDSIAPFTQSGIFAASSPIRSCMIVAVQASGRTVMSIGPLVSSPPTSLWWSMIARMSAALTLAGSSAGLLVSTMTHGLDAVWSASTPR